MGEYHKGREVCPLLYLVKQGDTLTNISRSSGISVQEILTSNIICNPNLIFPGLPLIIPEQILNLPKAGGYPYYILNYGDTLWCLSNQFQQSISSLAAANQIMDPNAIFSGRELLVRFEPPNPDELFEQWNELGGVQCDTMNSMQIHGVYYIGSFQWEALWERAIPYLLQLLNHPCDTVRFYTVVSLARIGTGVGIKIALQEAAHDHVSTIAEMARLGLYRHQLILNFGKRIHVVTNDTSLLAAPNGQSQQTAIGAGTPVIVLRWNIPSPTGEEGPRGDIQIYDLVQVPLTGQIGFLPRVGFNEIWLI